MGPDEKIKQTSGILLLLLFFLFTGEVKSQSTNAVTNQIWVDFNPSYNISKRFDLEGRLGTEDIFPHSWYKIYSRTDVAYSIPRFLFKHQKFSEKVYAGLELDYIFYTDQPNVFELSPYQGYSLKMPNFKRVVLQHKVELTERFQWAVNDWSYSFGIKLSYEGIFFWQFQGDVWKYAKRFDLSLSYKLWWNLISAAVNNNVARVTPGIGYTINPQWRVAFMVGYDYTENASDDTFVNNSIIYRFRIYYKIPRKNDHNR